jgi:nitrate reductase gamma subunit
MGDILLYIVFPYVAVFLAVFVSLYRYFTDRFSYSSLSSQMIEKRTLFWGIVPWHYGVIPILIIHLLGFALPGLLAVLHGSLATLYISELFGKVVTLLALMGIIILIYRRLAYSGIRLTTPWIGWC